MNRMLFIVFTDHDRNVRPSPSHRPARAQLRSRTREHRHYAMVGVLEGDSWVSGATYVKRPTFCELVHHT